MRPDEGISSRLAEQRNTLIFVCLVDEEGPELQDTENPQSLFEIVPDLLFSLLRIFKQVCVSVPNKSMNFLGVFFVIGLSKQEENSTISPTNKCKATLHTHSTFSYCRCK